MESKTAIKKISTSEDKKTNKITLIITTLVNILIIAVTCAGIVHKDVVFYFPKFVSLISISFIILILILIDYKKVKMDKKDIVYLIYLAISFISSVFAMSFRTAIIGAYSRYDGFLSLISYGILYYVGKNIYLPGEKTVKMAKVGLFLICLMGIIQNYIPFTPEYKSYFPILNNFVSAMFGNRNFMGSFIALVLPIMMGTYIFKKGKINYLITQMVFYCLLVALTRSAWISFAVCSLIGIIYLIKDYLKNKNTQYIKNAGALLIGFVVVFGLTNISGIANVGKRSKDFIKEASSVKEEGVKNEMGSGRIAIWKAALKVIKNKPILGVGVDNFFPGTAVYAYDDMIEYKKMYNGIVDKAHNEYLQIACTIGIPGLIIYFIYLGLICFPNIKKIKKDKVKFILFLSIISYLIQAFFNISVIAVAPLFFLLLGLIDNERFVEKIKKFT